MSRLLAGLLMAMSAPLLAAAQEGAVGVITMSPAHAAPESSVTFTLASPVIDLSASTIVWYVDGSRAAEGAGLTSVSTRLGGAGESTDVSAEITAGDETYEVFTSVTAAGLSLLWEAEGYTHPFYLGRSLPAPGAKIRFVALADDGSAPADLTYTWRRGSTVLGSLSGRGKNTLTVDAPLLFGSDTISVEARSANGALAHASARVSSAPPPILLYENHPLFGILFHKALPRTVSTPEIERGFAAYPFFAPVALESSPALMYEWRVNRERVAIDAARPSQITINAAGSDGSALIELLVTHTTNIFYSAEGLWRVTFNATGVGGGTSDPFAPQSSQ